MNEVFDSLFGVLYLAKSNPKTTIFIMENIKEQVQYNLSNYKSFGELMWITIKSHGDKIAHLDALTEETVTYAELQDKAVRCALWLQKQKIKSGDVISICTGNHLNSIVPCLSAAYINAIFNPWNENMDLNTTLYFLQMMTPKMIFCSEKSVNVVLRAIKEQNCSPTIVVFGKYLDVISFSDVLRNYDNAELANFRYIELDDIKKTACVLHSSGTTGMPKGVELSNYAMLNLSEQNIMNMSNVPSLCFSSLYWVSAVVINFNGILQSTKVIIYPEFNEEKTCQLIEKYQIQAVFLSTSMLNRLFQSGYVQKYPLLSLKIITTGGTLLKLKVEEELRCILSHVQISNCYGITELGGLATSQLPNHKKGSCGIVAKNVQIKIVDQESGKVLGSNKLGEIWLKSTSMMTGYYKNPEATRNTINKEGWLHSGDIGYIDEDEELFIVDRIKDLIKYRGHQISPGEIESILISHPAVLEASIIGIPHATDDEHPLAFVRKQLDTKVTEQELIDFVAKNMMDHCKLRAGVIFLDNFPYTATGKILKKDLKTMAKKLLKHNDY